MGSYVILLTGFYLAYAQPQDSIIAGTLQRRRQAFWYRGHLNYQASPKQTWSTIYTSSKIQEAGERSNDFQVMILLFALALVPARGSLHHSLIAA